MTVDRFLSAQSSVYPNALAELRAGKKRSHWMWFVFPQLKALGRSAAAEYYGIEDIAEAREYLACETLRDRLSECCNALLALATDDPAEVMGRPDDLKLRSSMTLFALADPSMTVCIEVLRKFYSGRTDPLTERFLGMSK